MSKPYHYARFRWGDEVDLGDVANDFLKDFTVKFIILPTFDADLTLRTDKRYKLQVTADTLTAFLAGSRATLSQKRQAPFTRKDIQLRTKILELYPHSRPSLLHIYSSKEPTYDVDNS